ncbi:MAG: hypothetical protein KDD10_11260, partial [Phaeodactylibacter sp.]|nr:hypothetical protein [Phaeodactylibacter sp.]
MYPSAAAFDLEGGRSRRQEGNGRFNAQGSLALTALGDEAGNSWLKASYSPAVPSSSTARRTSSTNSGVTSSTL